MPLRFPPSNAYQPDSPSAHGLVEWNYDPVGATMGSALTSGTLVLARLVAQTGGMISNIYMYVNSVGATLTAATTATVSGTANNGSGLVRITATAHGYSTNDVINITGIVGTTEANGSWVVTVIDANHFDLGGSSFINAYTSGGSAARSANCGVIYSSTGAILSATADQASTWAASTGLKTMPLGTPVTLVAGSVYYVGLLSVGSTAVAPNRGPTAGLASANEGGAGLRFAYNGTSLTKLPSSITPSSNSTSSTNAFSFWTALG